MPISFAFDSPFGSADDYTTGTDVCPFDSVADLDAVADNSLALHAWADPDCSDPEPLDMSLFDCLYDVDSVGELTSSSTNCFGQVPPSSTSAFDTESLVPAPVTPGDWMPLVYERGYCTTPVASCTTATLTAPPLPAVATALPSLPLSVPALSDDAVAATRVLGKKRARSRNNSASATTTTAITTACSKAKRRKINTSTSTSTGNDKTSRPLPKNASPASADESTTAPDLDEHCSRIVKAARDGDLAGVRSLLESPFGCEHRSRLLRAPTHSLGCSALHYAVFYNHRAIATYLVDCGADVNHRNLSGLSPLHWAIDREHWELASYLVRRGADPNLLGTDGLTLLHRLVAKSDVATLCTVLKLFVTDNDPTASTTDSRVALNLDLAASEDHQCITPLMLAASNGLLDTLELLLAAGADVGAYARGSGARATALHKAACKGHVTIVERLLQEICRVNRSLIDLQDSIGRTPLHYAAYYGRTDSVHRLLACAADKHKPDHRGLTPLALAQRKSPELYAIMLEHDCASA